LTLKNKKLSLANNNHPFLFVKGIHIFYCPNSFQPKPVTFGLLKQNLPAFTAHKKALPLNLFHRLTRFSRLNLLERDKPVVLNQLILKPL